MTPSSPPRQFCHSQTPRPDVAQLSKRRAALQIARPIPAGTLQPDANAEVICRLNGCPAELHLATEVSCRSGPRHFFGLKTNRACGLDEIRSRLLVVQ